MDVQSVRPAPRTPIAIWTLVLAASELLQFTTLTYFHAWGAIGVPSFLPAFLDWHGVVAASDCAKLGYDVYVQNPCDALNRLHNYSPIWLNVNILGLTRQNEWEVGAFISTAFLISAAFMLRPKSPKEFVLCLAALSSPAVMLGVEQANVDLLIFIALLPATFLFSRGGRIWHMAGLSLCVLLAALKFYPIAAVAPFFWTGTNLRNIVASSAVFALAGLTWVFFDFDNLRVVYSIAEKPGLGSNVAFGSSLIFLALGNTFPSLAWLSRAWVSLLLFLLLVGISLYYGKRLEKRPTIELRPDVASARFIAGSSIIILVFFLVTSYDYKTAFLLLLLPQLIRPHVENLPNMGADRRLAHLVLGLIIAVLWSTGVVNVVNNLAPDYRILVLLVKYLFSWALIFMLILLGSALAVRRWNGLIASLTSDALPVISPRT